MLETAPGTWRANLARHEASNVRLDKRPERGMAHVGAGRRRSGTGAHKNRVQRVTTDWLWRGRTVRRRRAEPLWPRDWGARRIHARRAATLLWTLVLALRGLPRANPRSSHEHVRRRVRLRISPAPRAAID